MTSTPYDQLLALIETSIIDRYDGDLERHEDPRMKRADWYTPRDTDAIRKLLTTLWSEHVTTKTIECVFETLVEYGAKHWPQARCEEELEREREQYLDNLDHAIDRAEEHLANLKQQYAQLAD